MNAPLSLPELPDKSQPPECENAQFDSEAPHNLSGVMTRWIVPEDCSEDRAPIVYNVPTLAVFIEGEIPDEPAEDSSETLAPPPRRLLLSLALGLGGLLVVSLIVNFILLFMRM